MRKEREYVCLKCDREFKSTEKEPKFCSRSCAAVYNNVRKAHDIDTKLKISLSVKEYYEKNPKEKIVRIYDYKCDICGEDFSRSKKFREGRHIRCPKCIQIRVHLKDLSNVGSMLELSKRTVSKVLLRMKIGCSFCGWNKCTGDIHHIVSRKNKGTDDHSNLSYLCPNCHRMAQRGLITPEQLTTMADYVGESWKKFYGEKAMGKQ